MKVLIVLTSHSQLGNSGKKTGFWIEEFAAPYYIFFDAGAAITLASPKGGQPPVDPQSKEPENETADTIRFRADDALQHLLANTKKLADVDAADFDGVFYPGGHGPLWDLTNDTDSIRLIETFLKNNKPVAAVCHAPAVLLNVQDETDAPMLKGRSVTGFSNSEEEAVQLTDAVPFLLEDELQKKGAIYSSRADWSIHVVTDGLLVTGQNPQSSAAAAKAFLDLLKKGVKNDESILKK
jgi:putative intracellular protease/amidase